MAKNFEAHTAHVMVDPDYTTRKYLDLIAKGMGVVFVLEVAGVIVGGIGGLKGPDLHWPRVIAVETFWFVLPEYRGAGLKLMSRFEQWAEENNCDAVAMVHLADSHPEILEKLYTRKGYQLVEKHYVKVLT
jgi:GNAT superfamily N-acetyltransferase